MEENLENDIEEVKINLKYKNEAPKSPEELTTTPFLENYTQIKVSKDLEFVGNEGPYQYYIFYIFSLTFLIMGFIDAIITYTYYLPEFHCLTEAGTSFKCSQKEACESGKYDYVKSRTSLITQFEMFCGDSKLLVTLTQTYIFTISAVITFFIMVVSDRIGRRRGFFIMIGFVLVGSGVGFFGESVWTISNGVLLMWTSTDIFYSMSLIYFNEITSDYLRSKVSIFFIIAAIGSISINGILLFIPDYKDFYMFCFFCSVFFSIFYFKFIPSPYYVFSTGDFLGYHNTLLQIGVKNGKDNEILKQDLKDRYKLDTILKKDISEVEILKIDDKTESIFQKTTSTFLIIFSKEYALTIFLCIIFYANNYINECINLIAPQKLGVKNIYLIKTLLSISDLLGYLIIIPISHTIKRRHLNIGCNIIYLTGAILLLLNEYNKHNYSYRVYATTLSCCLKMVNSACFSLSFNYISELFPSKIRGLATGLIVCFGRLSNSFASTIDHFSTIYDIHPLILTAIPSIFALPASYFLPETVNKNLIN